MDVVVTGGSSGIGLAVVTRLRETTDLAVIDVSRTTGHDVRNAHDIQRVYDGFGGEPPRFLVASAGIISPDSWLDMTEFEFDDVMSTNVTGAFIVAREHAKRLIAADRGGAIVFFGSPSARRPSGGNLAYGTSKAAVEAMGLGLARELEPHRIKVFILRPDHIDTPMLRSRGFNHLDDYPLLSAEYIADEVVRMLLTDSHLDGQVVNIGGSVLGKQQ